MPRSSPQAVPTTLAPSRSTSPIVRVTYAPVASQVIHGTLPPTPHFTPATPATPAISAIHLPIQARQMPVTMTCPAPVHYNRCPVNTFGQMQSQAPHLGQQPVPSSLPNGAGPGGIRNPSNFNGIKWNKEHVFRNPTEMLPRFTTGM